MKTARASQHPRSEQERQSWRPILAFFVLAVLLAWAVDLPLWLSREGLQAPFALVSITVSMFAPAVAALLMVVLVTRARGTSILRRLGWWPVRPWRRTILLAVIGLFGSALLPLLTVLLAAALGLVRLDLVHFSGFAATLRSHLPAGTALPMPVAVLAVIQLLSVPVAGIFNGLLTVGEETGWRGYLLPALRPLGTWPALLMSGALWGLWHAPVILLGYNFGQPNPFGLLMMVIGCALLGVLFGWLRIRSGNIWPSVVAHGAFNAGAGVLGLVGAAGTSADPVAVGALGWVAWIVIGVVVAVLLALHVVPASSGWADLPADRSAEASH